MHGFAKSERDNIRDEELAAFRLLAARLQAFGEAELAEAVAAGVFVEVVCDGQAIS